MKKTLRTREVKTFILEWVCGEKGCDGLMEHHAGMAVIMAKPSKYLHTCNKCGADEYSEETYPRAKIEYVDKPWEGR